jgi:hypothetical protein
MKWTVGRAFLTAVLIGLVLGLSAPAWAVTIYTYTGNPFTAVHPPYTTSDYVTVTMTLDSPIGNSQNNASEIGPNLLALSMSDGVQTIDLSTPTSSVMAASFYTDSQGHITDWSVGLKLGTSPSIAFIFTDSARYGGPEDATSTADGFSTTNAGTPGFWTPLPELDSMTLLAMGLVAMAGLMRRRV